MLIGWNSAITDLTGRPSRSGRPSRREPRQRPGSPPPAASQPAHAGPGGRADRGSAVTGEAEWAPPGVETKRANAARVYDYWLGGT
ncbi:MAG TPA: hypothetical protein VK784_10790, partial [Pseudonocardiaceae bacterium]|nr:hypothetical protein [Pseudonocardiaceae bacterium]